MQFPLPPNGFVLFADDLRQEIGNKPSLMGIYENELILPAGTVLPTAIAKLAVMIIWREPPEHYAQNLTFRITMCALDTAPDSTEEQTLLEFTIDSGTSISKLPPPTGPSLGISIKPALVISPLLISGPSKVRVSVIRDGEKWAIGKLDIPAPKPQETETTTEIPAI